MASSLDSRITEAAAQRATENSDSDKRWAKASQGLMKDLVYNMRVRSKAHGVKRADLALTLHKMLFDDTYFDVYDGDTKDRKVRTFFEPTIALYEGDKKAVLVDIKRALESQFPIPSTLNREWNPKWVELPFTPKRRGDKRTKRLTLRFDWSIKKVE